jgi:hypothetical protein
MDGLPEQLGVAPLLLLLATYAALAALGVPSVNSALCSINDNAINYQLKHTFLLTNSVKQSPS